MRVGPAPKAKVSFLGGTQNKSPGKRERVLGARFVLGDRDPEGPWKQMTAEPQGDGATRYEEERPLDTWSRCAPIRLAGYEDDLSETHILRGID